MAAVDDAGRQDVVGSTVSRAAVAKVAAPGLCLILAAVGTILLASLTWELGALARGGELHHSHYDFLAFYSAAHFVSLGRLADVYHSPSVLASYQRTLVPHAVGAAGYMPFLNPPFAAVLEAPLALLTEPAARLVWFGLNALLAVWVAIWVTSSMPGKRRALAAVLVLGTFPFYQALIEGQWSFVLLVGCLAALHFARRGSNTRAGACLSVLWLKPQLAVIVLAGLLLFRCWRIAVAMAATAGLVALLTLPITGVHVYTAYVPFLINVSRDHLNGAGALHPAVWYGRLSLAQGINGLFAALFGQTSPVVVNAFSFLAIGATLIVFRRAALSVRPGFGQLTNELMLVASIGLGLLVDPHLFPQDITLLFLIVPILSPHLRNPFPALVVLCLIADAPLIDEAIPLHLFTVSIWGLTMLILLAFVRGGVHARTAPAAQNANDLSSGRSRLGSWLAQLFELAPAAAL